MKCFSNETLNVFLQKVLFLLHFGETEMYEKQNFLKKKV